MSFLLQLFVWLCRSQFTCRDPDQVYTDQKYSLAACKCEDYKYQCNGDATSETIPEMNTTTTDILQDLDSLDDVNMYLLESYEQFIEKRYRYNSTCNLQLKHVKLQFSDHYLIFLSINQSTNQSKHSSRNWNLTNKQNKQNKQTHQTKHTHTQQNKTNQAKHLS